MLLSIGMTLVIATGGVDLSVGSIMAIAAAVAAQVVVGGNSAALAFAAAAAVALLAGAWNGMLVAVLGIQPIVATLILMVAGRGIAHLVTGSQIITFTDPAYSYLGTGYLFALPFSLTVVAVTLAATAVLVRRTALGLFVEAVGGNATASRYAGVNATAVKWMVYVFSGACACVAGLITAADINAADPNNNGQYLELDAILAVVIGGTALTGGRFSLPGSIIGALVIQTLTTTILTYGVAPQKTLVVRAAVVIVVCLLQSEGLREKVAYLRKARSA
jgi:simple sugar transport system permease protein